MSKRPAETDFARLALAELEAAAAASSPEEQKAHLDRAAVYAARDEAERLAQGSG